MPIKAEIIITNRDGQVFEGVAELFPRSAGDKKQKTHLTDKIKGLKKARSKIVIRLRQFISEGYFNRTTKRTISDINEKLRTKGMVLKNTQLQPYLTQMVISDELEREQVNRGNRKVFVYFNT